MKLKLAMSEIANVFKYSSTLAISPQYLNVFTSNWVQKFLRGLGIFVDTALLKMSALIKKLICTIFCKLLKR